MLLIGAFSSGVNWILLYWITSYFKLWYIDSEIIATFAVFILSFNLNVLAKVVRINKELDPE